MKLTTVYAMIWLAAALAISVAIFVTKSATPLWALFIPAFVSMEAKE